MKTFAILVALLSQAACANADDKPESPCIYHHTKLPPRKVIRVDETGGIKIEEIPVEEVTCELRHPKQSEP